MHKLSEILKKIKEEKSSAFLYTSSYNKSDAISYLFNNPEEIISITSLNELELGLNRIDELADQDKFILSLLDYEAGYLFEEKLQNFITDNKTLMRFLVFDSSEVDKIASNEISFDPFEQDYKISDFHLNETERNYLNKIYKIKEYIKQGDTYQVNYTLKGKFNFKGEILDFVQNLIFNQSTQYSAFINYGNEFVISISPELFFSTNGYKINTRPMKGTIKRGINLEDDSFRAEELRNSKKDKAENIMIVDLLRNDIGKISKTNSVNVDSIYDVEKYETIFQLTSKVHGILESKKYSKIISNLFPCGSITGAPKIRTMKIINELENEKRGLYTGAIGFIHKDNSVFNVAIRTISIDKKTSNGEIGLGSGIVWDSNAEDEFNEVSLKSNFLVNPDKYFEIFETMLLEDGKIFLLDNHINRIEKAADYFLFKFNKNLVLEKLNSSINNLDSNHKFKIKLVLTKSGEIRLDINKIETSILKRAVISSNKINKKNRFQYFKTTNRELYDSEFTFYRMKNYFDVIYFNEFNELAEGSISNIFIRSKDIWKTPSIDSGILNGTYRNKFISENNVIETCISKEELLNSDEILLTNSLRKEVDIFELYENNDLVWRKTK